MIKPRATPLLRSKAIVPEDAQFPLPAPEEKGRWDEQWRRHMTLMACWVSIALNLVGGLCLAFMFPLNALTPYTLELVPESAAYVDIAPVSSYLPWPEVQILARQQAENYVVLRHEVVRDPGVMDQRWNSPGTLMLESTPAEYNKFLSGAGSSFAEIRRDNATVQVQIDTLNVIQDWTPQQHGFYQVQFYLIERDSMDKVVLRKHYNARIEVDYVRLTHVPYTMRFYNPYGFQVQAYALYQD